MATPDSKTVQAFAEIRLQQVARLAALQRTYGATFNGLGRALTARAMITLVRDCHAAGVEEHRVVAALKGTEPALPASDPLRDAPGPN